MLMRITFHIDGIILVSRLAIQRGFLLCQRHIGIKFLMKGLTGAVMILVMFH